MWKRPLVFSLISVFCAASIFWAAWWLSARILSMARTPAPPVTFARVFAAETPPPPPPTLGPGTMRAKLSRMQNQNGDSLEYLLDASVYPEWTKRLRGGAAFRSHTVIGDALAFNQVIGMSRRALVRSLDTEIALTTALPYVQIQIPTEMKVSSDSQASAVLNPLTSSVTPEMKVAPQLVGTDSAFEIKGPARPDDRSWIWTITPKAVGDQRILTLQFPTAPRFEFKFENRAIKNLIVKGSTVTAIVDVRDELGLTRAQGRLTALPGVVITILSLVLGFPFIKSKFASKPETSRDASPVPPVQAPPPPRTGNPRKKRRKR